MRILKTHTLVERSYFYYIISKNYELGKENKRLKERLEIAKKALKSYEDKQNWDIRGVAFMKYNKGFKIARKALKEMKGVK